MVFKKNKQKAENKSYEQAKNQEDKENLRKPGETTQAYNERVPIAFQPLAQPIELDYLGRPLK
jgi:hypothetical protein